MASLRLLMVHPVTLVMFVVKPRWPITIVAYSPFVNKEIRSIIHYLVIKHL